MNRFVYLPPEIPGTGCIVASLPEDSAGLEEMIGTLDRMQAWAKAHADAVRDLPPGIPMQLPMNGGCFTRLYATAQEADELAANFEEKYGTRPDMSKPHVFAEDETAALLSYKGASFMDEWLRDAEWTWDQYGTRQDMYVEAGKGAPRCSVLCTCTPDDYSVTAGAFLEELNGELKLALAEMKAEEAEGASPAP